MTIKNFKKNITLLAIVAGGFALPHAASAMNISGAIGFGGNFLAIDSAGNTVANMANATGLNFIDSEVTQGTGDFAGLVGASAVGGDLGFQDFQFSPGLDPDPVSPLWTVLDGPTTWTFDLEAVNVDFQDSNFLNLSGSGTLMADGFDDTNGNWTFSGDRDGIVLFSFSSITAAVPEPGTLLLLGLGALGLAASRRRRS